MFSFSLLYIVSNIVLHSNNIVNYFVIYCELLFYINQYCIVLFIIVCCIVLMSNNIVAFLKKDWNIVNFFYDKQYCLLLFQKTQYC